MLDLSVGTLASLLDESNLKEFAGFYFFHAVSGVG